MKGIVADVNFGGQLQRIVELFQTDRYRYLWEDLRIQAFQFEALGVPESASDREVWIACQDHEYVLVTGNRNSKGIDPLEAINRELSGPLSLPVFTVANLKRLSKSNRYMNAIAIDLLEHLFDMQNYLGSGRIFLPKLPVT